MSPEKKRLGAHNTSKPPANASLLSFAMDIRGKVCDFFC